MALPANQIENFRNGVSGTVDALRGIDSILARVEDFGSTDAERQAFFQASFGPDTDNPDLTWADFAQGILALRAIRTAWIAQRLAIVKLRR